MAPLYKVTIETTIEKPFFVRAETEDFARDIAMDELFGDPLGYFLITNEDVYEVEEAEVDEDEVLSR